MKKYTSIGCYPIFYITSDHRPICADCAHPSFLGHVNWENPNLYCADCDERIESAYAEEEEEEEESFNQWINDGNAHQLSDGYWVEQTTQYRKKFTSKELKEFYKKEYL